MFTRRDRINTLAAFSGMSRETQMLDVVDQLTPDGRLPTQQEAARPPEQFGCNAGTRNPLAGSLSRCPLLAQSGHDNRVQECPLSGVKRTSARISGMSAYDP